MIKGFLKEEIHIFFNKKKELKKINKRKHKRKKEVIKMSKNKSLKSQFHFTINDNFNEGIDKHNYKEQNGREMDNKIFSYDSKFNTLDVAKNFSNFLKENFEDIKQIKDIKAEHIQSFLTEKSKNCSNNTLQMYSSTLNKLELAAEKTFGINLQWKGEYVIPQSQKSEFTNRGANAVISREDLNKIVNYASENRSQSGDVVRLQSELGVRINEIISIKKSDINLEKGTIELKNCKGGRDLTREISAECKELVKEILKENYGKDTLFTIKGNSVNRYLRETEDKLGLSRHSTHDIRRCLAQEKFDSYRKEGYGIKESLDKTSVYLNHNKDREEMLKQSYVGNIH